MMEKSIKLRRFVVNGLFGRLSYDIDFSKQESASIIIAPNGCGKTTIFKFINFIFNPSISGFLFARGVPFESCECHLSNGKKVELRKKELKGRGGEAKTSFVWTLQNNRHIDIESPVDDEDLVRFEATADGDMGYFDNPRFVRRFHATPYGVHVHFEEMSKSVTGFLESNKCALSVNFISADRLHSTGRYIDPRIMPTRMQGYERELERPRDPMELIQLKIRRLYAKIQEQYNAKQQEMKDRLPKMYLKTTKEKNDFESFKKRWESYVGNIEKFCEIGLLQVKQTFLEMGNLEDAYKKKSAFLEVYLDAFEQTLPPLEEHYERMKLFVDILNKRNAVTEKVLSYSDEGLVMKMAGEPIRLDCLSSGEKNDLIMFFNLIFGSKAGGLVLVDEPEISLHIEWQEQYLEYLLRICELNGLQAIVATHSPSIVNGRFELYADFRLKK